MLLLWTHIRSKRVYKFRMGAISILLMTTRTTSTVKEGVSGFYDYPLLSLCSAYFDLTHALCDAGIVYRKHSSCLEMKTFKRINPFLYSQIWPPMLSNLHGLQLLQSRPKGTDPITEMGVAHAFEQGWSVRFLRLSSPLYAQLPSI